MRHVLNKSAKMHASKTSIRMFKCKYALWVLILVVAK